MSEQAKRRLVSALVKLAKVSKTGGYEGLRGGAKKRRPRKVKTVTLGGALSGGRKRVGRPRKRAAGSLGVTNISTTGAGLSGGRRKRATRKRASGLSGGSSWITFVKKYSKDHNIPYGQALAEAGDAYRRSKGQSKGRRK
jgi:hypothetical protein